MHSTWILRHWSPSQRHDRAFSPAWASYTLVMCQNLGRSLHLTSFKENLSLKEGRLYFGALQEDVGACLKQN
jgi:hypothetical protein